VFYPVVKGRIDKLFCGLVLPHNVPCKIVQNGLPALALLLLRMRRLRIKRDTHGDAVFCRQKLDHAGAVAEGISISWFMIFMNCLLLALS